MATIKDTAGNIHKTTSLFIDITGKEFGRTRVLALYSKIDSGWKHKYYWLCACSCGTFHVTNGDYLKSGDTKSCGCLVRDKAEAIDNPFTLKYKTHGLSGTREHKAWKRVKARCFDKNHKDYPTYSRLGMSESMAKDFTKFLEEIGPIPDSRPRWSVGRIDNTIGYYEGNIKWERDEEQSKNKGAYKNNKSGINGVYLSCLKGEPVAWVASWYDLNKKQHLKSYTISRWGDEIAKQLATEKRAEEFQRLKDMGAPYMPNHGLKQENQ